MEERRPQTTRTQRIVQRAREYRARVGGYAGDVYHENRSRLQGLRPDQVREAVDEIRDEIVASQTIRIG